MIHTIVAHCRTSVLACVRVFLDYHVVVAVVVVAVAAVVVGEMEESW
jgi:hypothetical protein